MIDNIKTIREALDEFYLELRTPGRYAEETLVEARAALDSLDAELVELVKERDGLRLQVESARRMGTFLGIAPADSPPGDDIEALIRTASDIGHYNAGPAEDEAFDEVCRLARAGFAHLRSQQPETEEQRAERELGAWLVAHPGETSPDVWRDEHVEENRWLCMSAKAPRTLDGYGPTRAAAILAALAKARDAEGGK